MMTRGNPSRTIDDEVTSIVNGGGKLGQMPAPESANSAPRFQTVGAV
jgi:hypothetical protein